MLTKEDFFNSLSTIIVGKDWDLPSQGFDGYLPRKYQGPDSINQQNIIKEGQKLSKSEHLNQQLIGYGLEAYGRFYRSLESAVTQNRKHPEGFNEYFAHYLYSDPSYVPSSYQKLSKFIQKPSTIKIKKGGSYWKFRQNKS